MKKRVVILITGRLKSTRLKRKALLDLSGKPMFSQMVDRLKRAKIPEDIVLCTSPLTEDDPLAELAMAEGIKCFRGDPDDVLFRLYGAAVEFEADVVINCMADNPLTDPEFIDRLATFHVEGNYDYSRTNGLPLGLFSYALSRTALKEVCEIKDDIDTEIWGGYFTETNRFSCGVMEVEGQDVRAPELRLTVDTAEDFAVMEKLFASLDERQLFDIREIVKYCRNNPEIMAINSKVVQVKGHKIKLKGE